MKNAIYEQSDLLDLADDVGKAAWIEFFLGTDDRSPDGTRLSRKGKNMLEAALRFFADHAKKSKRPK